MEQDMKTGMKKDRDGQEMETGMKKNRDGTRHGDRDEKRTGMEQDMETGMNC